MNENNGIKALKSGIWYTVANFITKSIGLITTPIFTRLLTHDEYGLVSNYMAWMTTFLVFVTLNLGASFISARFDYEDDFDGYVSSTLVLSSLVTGLWFIAVNLFPAFFSSFTGIEHKYINIMFVYLLLYTAIDLFQTRERYYYGYKKTVAISLGISLSTALVSVLLVLNMEDRLFGRIVGSALPTIIVGAILYLLILIRGKRIDIRYWKYALPICIPFIPHLLSLSLLNSMDKMMITRICGAGDNALYSVAYSCGAVITLLVSSLNSAFAPWLGEKLNAKCYDEIEKVSRVYMLLFAYAACGVMLITPEVLLVMGGRGFSEAIYVMPPVTCGCVCQFLYTMYVNVEQFSKKTIGMAFASAFAALSNYVLNSIFIPQYGYIAAAYTTLASFFILLLLHMWIVKRIGLQKVYSSRLVFIIIGSMIVYTLGIQIIYHNGYVRLVAVLIYIAITLVCGIKYKSSVISAFRNGKSIE